MIAPKKKPPEGGLAELLDDALRPKREPILGPNARPVFVQFATVLVVGFSVSWLLDDLFGAMAKWIVSLFL